MITVVGLGPGPFDLLTLRAARTLEAADQVFLRTARHPTVKSFPAATRWVSFDEIYEQSESFQAVYESIVSQLISQARSGRAVVYAVPGDPSFGEESVRQLIEQAPRHGLEVRLVPGVSFLSPVLAAGPGSVTGHLQIMDALDPVELNPTLPVVVYQVYDRRVASTVKLDLLRFYPAEHEITLVRGEAGEARAAGLKLADLDRQADLGHLTSVYVPALQPEQATSSPFGLRQIVHRLRAPGGCPWDREQTPASLVRYLLEETYEAADAISEEDPQSLREELGDVLLQVYLQAEIAEEQGDFDVTDVIGSISEKLIRRHPHVFADVEVSTAEEVVRNWEKLKRAEKGESVSDLDRIPRSLPALARAQEIQRRMIKVGFNWESRAGALGKLEEELAELRAALDDPLSMAHELGDVLFMLAKLATDAGLDAEAALRAANQRVSSRYRYLEQAAAKEGTSVKELDLPTLLGLWDEAKQAERQVQLD